MGGRGPGGSSSCGAGSGAEGPRRWCCRVVRWMCGRPARRPDDSLRCFSNLQEAQNSIKSSSEASIGIDVASAEQANSVSLCLPSHGRTTTAESTVGGSRAQPPQLLWYQEFAMDRSHPTPRALEKPVHLLQKRERERADTMKRQSRDEIVPQQLLSKGFPCNGC